MSISPAVNLKIDSSSYSGWQTAEISKHIEAISSSFQLSIADIASQDLSRFPISINSKAVLNIEDRTVISGFVDSVDVSYSKDTSSVLIAGRDNTANLVDCSVVLGRDEFLEQSLQQIADALCNPLGVPVKASLPVKIPRFKINPGETAFEALDRAAKYQGVLLRPDGLGNLVTAKIGEEVTRSALIEGRNILSASLSLNGSDRYSDYIVKAQNLDQDEPNIEETAKDRLGRYRPLLIVSGTQIDRSAARMLAEWEAAVRAARSFSLTIETPDWRDAKGELWEVGSLVRVVSQRLSIDASLLIKSLRFTKSLDQGTLTSLELTLPGAYLPRPVLEEVI